MVVDPAKVVGPVTHDETLCVPVVSRLLRVLDTSGTGWCRGSSEVPLLLVPGPSRPVRSFPGSDTADDGGPPGVPTVVLELPHPILLFLL